MSFVVLNCQVVECVDIFANPVFKNPGINILYKFVDMCIVTKVAEAFVLVTVLFK